VNLRPAGTGVDVVVRYITRAGVRLETRNRLFETVVELMQGDGKGSDVERDEAKSELQLAQKAE